MTTPGTLSVEVVLPRPFVEVQPEDLDPYAALLGSVDDGQLLLAANALPDDPDEPGAGLLLALRALPIEDPAIAAEGTLLVLRDTVSTRGTLQRVDLPAGPAVLVSDLVEVELPDTDDLAVLVGLHQLWLPVSGLGLLTLSISTARVDEHEEYRELTLVVGEQLSCRMSS